MNEINSMYFIDVIGVIFTFILSIAIMNVFFTQRLKIWFKVSTSKLSKTISWISCIFVTIFVVSLCAILHIGMFKFFDFDFTLVPILQLCMLVFVSNVCSNWLFDQQLFKLLISWLEMDKEFQHSIKKYRK